MNSPKRHILLTGGTGAIGSHLTGRLLEKGYRVSHLSRSPGNDARVQTFLWDVAKGEIDAHCIDGVDTVVHLAGAGIAKINRVDLQFAARKTTPGKFGYIRFGHRLLQRQGR